MGNEFDNQGASDISFIIIETPHPRFKREGDNLKAVVELTLKEVWLFFERINKIYIGFTWVWKDLRTPWWTQSYT